MPRKPSKSEAASGAMTATAAGPAQTDGNLPPPAADTPSGPTSFAENDALLQTERKQADSRARHLFGLDAQPADAPRFDAKDPKHKPSQRDLEVAAGEDDEHPEGSTESAGDVSSDQPEEAQWAQPQGEAREADEEKTSEPASDQDYEAALKALRLDFGDDASHLIKTLEPEQIKLLGKKARLRQRDVSLRLQELGETRGKPENGQATPEVKAQPVLQPTADWTARLRQTAEALGLDEEATGVLGDTIRSAALELVEPLVGQTKAASNAIAFLIEDRARARLGQDLPALVTDADAWKKVAKKAQLLLASPDYTNIDDAFDDAADLVTRGGLSQARRQDKSQARRSRTQSQPTSPRSRSTTQAARVHSGEERMERIFYKQWSPEDQARYEQANKDRRIF